MKYLLSLLHEEVRYSKILKQMNGSFDRFPDLPVEYVESLPELEHTTQVSSEISDCN